MEKSVITEYRYITRNKNICGGHPIIKGTRIPVQSIVGYYKLGLSVEEILEGLPHISPAQIYEALSYYHDHQEEIEHTIQDNQSSEIIERYNLVVGEKGRLVLKDSDD